jgi:hypothetical protein
MRWVISVEDAQPNYKMIQSSSSSYSSSHNFWICWALITSTHFRSETELSYSKESSVFVQQVTSTAAAATVAAKLLTPAATQQHHHEDEATTQRAFQ